MNRLRFNNFSSIKNYFIASCDSSSLQNNSNESKSLIKNNFKSDLDLNFDDEPLPTQNNSIFTSANKLRDNPTPSKIAPPSYSEIRNSFFDAPVQPFEGLRIISERQVGDDIFVEHNLNITNSNKSSVYSFKLSIDPEDKSTLKYIELSTDKNYLKLYNESTTKFYDNENTYLNVNNYLVLTSIFSKFFSKASLRSDNYCFELKNISNLSEQHLPPINSYSNSVAYIQNINQYLSLGGQLTYASNEGLNYCFAGILYYKDGKLTCQHDSESTRFLYTRNINPDRFYLTTTLEIEPKNKMNMKIIADYKLVNADCRAEVNSDLDFSSSLRTTIVPGASFDINTSVSGFANNFKYGFGVYFG